MTLRLISKGTILWLLLASSLALGSPPQAAEQTRSPHGNLNISCQNCHTVYGWKPIRAVPEFDHNQTKFPLRGLHEGVNCVNCHTKMVFSNVGNKCAECHADIHRGKMSGACESCHTVRGWKVSVAQINLHQNRFPLTGAHAAASCDDCHKNGGLSNFNLMSTACIGCHRADFNGTTNPKHTAATFFGTQPCESCHNTDTWANAKFDHSVTGFPLSGSHAVPPRTCADCHVNNNYNLASTACITCHLNDYNKTTNPNHPQQAKIFTTTCENCHTTVAWTPATFDHNLTGFQLTGAHTVPPRQCADCHTSNNYNLPMTACVGCHLNDYKGATNPNHVTANLPQTCDLCHSTSAWQPAQFDHSKSGFPLTGQHTVPPRQCADCHVNNNYNLTATACVSCHLKDFNGTTNPNHVTGNFPQTCDVCHTTSGWSPASFDHSKTGFQLTGQHTVPPRACSDCHINNNYNLTTTTCVSCHQTDYNNALTPVNHPQANFPLTCDSCHDTIAWTDGKFDHSSTGFTLTGSHMVPPRACIDCHVNGNYKLPATTCVGCHQNDYNNAIAPVNHVAAKFPTACDGCHDTVQWSDGVFNHATTGWALTNSHMVPPRACTDCHTATVGYNITVTTCVSCHQTDYNNATTPVNHVGANFPLTCDTCHDTIQWSDGKFDHTPFGFPLTNAHAVPPRVCTDCHNAQFGGYNIASTACVNCHLTEFNSTNNPNHIAVGFPNTCQVCHDTIAWTDAVFNHNNTPFPLQGAHTTVPCANCHVNNNYTTLPTDCYGCHAADYNTTTNPSHKAAGFPTTCLTCHTTWITTNWLGAVFNHTWFPMTHGNANGVCATCHTNPNDYSVFQCTGCHGNNNPANFQHEQVPGYVYNSVNCYQCHKTGGGG